VIRVAWRIRAGIGRQLVELRVTDGGAPETPHQREAGPDSIDGRGLAIVAALADRWGVESDGLGQSVWAELSLPRASSSGQPTARTAAPGAEWAIGQAAEWVIDPMANAVDPVPNAAADPVAGPVNGSVAAPVAQRVAEQVAEPVVGPVHPEATA
jgi:hypothetical protein